MQRALSLIRGEPIFVRPPIDSMDGLWSPAERAMVESRMTVAAVGGPAAVRQKLEEFFRETHVDEVIFTSDIYSLPERLRSFELAAEAVRALQPSACTV